MVFSIWKLACHAVDEKAFPFFACDIFILPLFAIKIRMTTYLPCFNSNNFQYMMISSISVSCCHQSRVYIFAFIFQMYRYNVSKSGNPWTFIFLTAARHTSEKYTILNLRVFSPHMHKIYTAVIFLLVQLFLFSKINLHWHLQKNKRISGLQKQK